MDYPGFERLISRLAREIPDEYMEGIVSIEVSPKAVPHPLRTDVYTMGECIPVHSEGNTITSRVVLYHGSFRALADMRPEFEWREEAWETLTHELRHHLEWLADAQALEEYDWAAEHNFARHEGQPFDPLFFQAGEEQAPGYYKVEDDIFVDRPVRKRPDTATLEWRGDRYDIPVPAAELPLYLLVEGVRQPPPGDLILVLRRKPRLRDILLRQASPTQHVARAKRR